MKSSRLIYEKPIYYSNRVLLGNWFEENIGRYKKNNYEHATVYNQDFIPKCAVDKNSNNEIRNDTQIKSEHGDHISPPRITDEFPNFYENFTTTYDLSYKYFPAWIGGSINRKLRLSTYEPTNEYLAGYGNLSSKNGLTEDKINKWKCDVLDPRRTEISIAKSDYIKYGSEAYKLAQWPRLHPVKTKCGHAVSTFHTPLPANHPRSIEGSRNPIIWEGHGYDEDLPIKSCVCNF